MSTFEVFRAMFREYRRSHRQFQEGIPNPSASRNSYDLAFSKLVSKLADDETRRILEPVLNAEPLTEAEVQNIIDGVDPRAKIEIELLQRFELAKNGKILMSWEPVEKSIQGGPATIRSTDELIEHIERNHAATVNIIETTRRTRNQKLHRRQKAKIRNSGRKINLATVIGGAMMVGNGFISEPYLQGASASLGGTFLGPTLQRLLEEQV